MSAIVNSVKSEQVFGRSGMSFLPAFVRKGLQYLADIFDWYPDDEEEDPFNFTYWPGGVFRQKDTARPI